MECKQNSNANQIQTSVRSNLKSSVHTLRELLEDQPIESSISKQSSKYSQTALYFPQYTLAFGPRLRM